MSSFRSETIDKRSKKLQACLVLVVHGLQYSTAGITKSSCRWPEDSELHMYHVGFRSCATVAFAGPCELDATEDLFAQCTISGTLGLRRVLCALKLLRHPHKGLTSCLAVPTIAQMADKRTLTIRAREEKIAWTSQ
ncbi:hypothetical protein BaRGS_00015603 [Batillaria attramentaria]|uniref:Uncharacterized protein n=1 Tax=Batillaria attramentaria TaxID=370345 RepID=A0ABD0L108_9CAEN